MHADELAEAPDEQARSREQHDGGRDLEHGQRVSRTQTRRAPDDPT